MSEQVKPIECPNCGSSNNCYNIADWEDGCLVDAAFFECFDCHYNTGYRNTETEVMAVIDARKSLLSVGVFRAKDASGE